MNPGIPDDGGPAFPQASPEMCIPGQTCGETQGMTLRDWFAGKAMGALIVDPERVDQSREECARLSYLMADATLKARKGGTEP